MKILVLGATGGTGREIVRAAQAQGHDVVALVRSTTTAAILTGVTLVEGDARDEAALVRALSGCEAVVSALGTGISLFREVTLLSAATRALVSAMRRTGVRRLICITGLGAGDSRGHGGLVYDRVIQPLLLRKVYEDKDRQEVIVRASALDWTIVRPVMLTDKPARGQVRATTDMTVAHGATIPRADVGRFVVEQLTSEAWLRRTPLISS